MIQHIVVDENIGFPDSAYDVALPLKFPASYDENTFGLKTAFN
jgi:hypothetical protein